MNTVMLEREQEELERLLYDDQPLVPTDVRRAIAASFQNARGTLEIKPLWQRTGRHFFRVNWWTNVSGPNPRILESAFVSVSEVDGMPLVENGTVA